MGLYDTATAPPPPDPYKTAGAQFDTNFATNMANSIFGNANQYSPYGSTVFKESGDYTTITGPDGKTYQAPRMDQTTTLSPEQQALYNQQVSNQQKLGAVAGRSIDSIGGILGSRLNTSKIPGLISSVDQPSLATSYDPGFAIQKSVDLNSNAPTRFGQTAGQIQYDVGANDFSADRQRVEDALFSRLEPRLESDRAALDTRLRNQGLTPGSAAYNNAMNQVGRDSNDARMQAILAGGQEQSRLFGMDVAQGQFNNAAQQQDYAQQQGRGQFAQAGIGLNNAALLSEGQFRNAAQGQQNSQNAALAAFGNASRQQMFANALEDAGLNNQTAAQALQQQLAIRQTPINEINSLMSGSQVQGPQVTAYRPSNMGNTDVMGSIYNAAALQNQQYQQQQQSQNAMMGGIFGGLGSLLGAGMMGGAGGFSNSMFGKLFGVK